jgi:hypothetical protein
MLKSKKLLFELCNARILFSRSLSDKVNTKRPEFEAEG